MRKVVLGSIALFLVAALGGAGHASVTSRTEKAPYDMGAGVRLDGFHMLWSLPLQTWATFHARPGDRRARIEVQDTLGALSLIHVHVDRDGDGVVEVDRDFCASSIDLKVTGKTLIDVFPVSGICHDGTLSLASRGEIVATFSR